MLSRPVFASLVLAGLCLAIGQPAIARELGTAPELRVLGFSADGRHFGIEQSGGDGASERGAFAIDVIDRNTGRSATGFPRGVTQLSWDSEPNDARREAMRDFSFDEDKDDSMQTPAIVAWARAAAAPRLQEISLSDPGQRLAGRSWTDLTRINGPIRFMTRPDIIGAHPGVSMKYTLTARMPAPHDPQLRCREREASASARLTVTLKPEIPASDRESARRNPQAFAEQNAVIDYVLPPKTCAIGVHVTDVYRNSDATTLGVVVLVLLDVGHSDSGEYRAVAFPLR
ncbi:hypothetical protein E8L99_02580 [Phreatobacter aquaticus]|uniref:DUF2259 domain-containing protein n=1 Tax=Phreatobacter aquaticus TaxID=2570229 RepID=A0A4D7QGH3_9HYPH|nr:hypothetical protein [Phreatobacter aquaticus]QCK84743.1 hypothetical protein E8L99_02580 [Phreatobacter aquaticus]